MKLGRYDIRTPSICVPIIGKDIGSMEKRLERALSQGAKLVELRLDKLEDSSEWKNLLRDNIPTIVTVRSEEEGGYFKGSEEERISLLQEAVDYEVSCIDIELSTSSKKRKKILEAAKRNEIGVILSFHDFEGVPPIRELKDKVEKMVESKCDFAKTIGFANKNQDALRMLDFLIWASDGIQTPVIAFAMGEKGKFTRVTAPLLGSPITYASVEKKTAPGQLDFTTVKQILGKFRD